MHERSVRTTAEGLPVGMQILTRHFDETTMFRLADAFEKAGGVKTGAPAPASHIKRRQHDSEETKREMTYPYDLPPLPYAPEALEPYIDKMTMEIHHGKHHNAYVTNLNKALESAPELAGKTVEELLANNCAIVPENIRTAVRNNGGGHINHSMFWKIMAPGARWRAGRQRGPGHQRHFRRLRHFKEKFNQAAATPLRLGLGVAGEDRRQAGNHFHRQSGQPGDGGQVPGDGPGRVGARLLPEVSEPPARLHRRLVERGELAGNRIALQLGEVIPGGTRSVSVVCQDAR